MSKELIKRSLTSVALILILISMFISSTMMISIILIVCFITFYEFNRLVFRIIKKRTFKFLISSAILLYLFVFVFIILFVESTQYLTPKYKIFIFYSLNWINCTVGRFIINNYYVKNIFSWKNRFQAFRYCFFTIKNWNHIKNFDIQI